MEESKPAMIRISGKLRDQLKKRADKEYRTITGLATMILSEALKDEEVKTK